MKIAFAPLFALLLLGTPVAAMADVIEGPAGCTWNATVKKVNKSSMSVHVDEQYGSCVDEACPIDAEGKTYNLSGKKKYKAGEVIKIWVDLDKKDKEHATLDIPKCWTQTVGMNTADTAPAPTPAPSFDTSANMADMPPVTPPPALDPVTADDEMDMTPIGDIAPAAGSAK